MATFESLIISESPGQLSVANGNVMFILGNGTQGFFGNKSYVLEGHMEERFGTDAYLNDVAGSIDSRFAVVTLNISWPFPHQFAFHGTLAHNTIPEPSKVDEHIGEALKHLGEAFDSDSAVHIVFIGVGLTGANGFGLLQFLSDVQDEYGISRITVVDIKAMTTRRANWLQSAFDPPVEVEHVGQTAESWLASARLRDSMVDYTGPTFAQMSKMLTSKKCAEAMLTSDGRVVDFIAKLHRLNGLQADARSKRKRSACSKNISRMDESIATEVVALTERRSADYWLKQKCTRVIKADSGTNGYIDGVIVSHRNGRWQLRHDDGDYEWLQLYEVILGVQLFRVKKSVLKS